jgi:aryl-alcohol dehydrogenase-like predicted oxidoreductase
VLSRGDDIIPIPGTKHRRYLEENVAALNLALSPDDLARLEAVAPRGAASGERYPEAMLKMVNL